MYTKKHQTKAVHCPYCGSPAVVRPAAEIYHDLRRTDSLYVCSNHPACNAYVGMNTKTGKPLGPLADGDLRNLRIRAHRTFDRLWQSGIMTRNSAYRWMADYFCIPLSKAHIGQLSEYRCNELIAKCKELFAKGEKI